VTSTLAVAAPPLPPVDAEPPPMPPLARLMPRNPLASVLFAVSSLKVRLDTAAPPAPPAPVPAPAPPPPPPDVFWRR
jgi:hypothetical protein